MPKSISDISQKEFKISEMVKGASLRETILLEIQKDFPHFGTDNYIALSELEPFRTRSISEYLSKQIGELSKEDELVLNSLNKDTTLSAQIDNEKIDSSESYTFGQIIADKVASFGGSWRFIIMFGVFILIWILANAFLLLNKGFDPYPFILLNLILSCLAALQAPVIMMSQNRQEEKDRDRAKRDYMVNLKAELEIRILHEKIEHLIVQHNELLEAQKDNHAKLYELIGKK